MFKILGSRKTETDKWKERAQRNEAAAEALASVIIKGILSNAIVMMDGERWEFPVSMMRKEGREKLTADLFQTLLKIKEEKGGECLTPEVLRELANAAVDVPNKVVMETSIAGKDVALKPLHEAQSNLVLTYAKWISKVNEGKQEEKSPGAAWAAQILSRELAEAVSNALIELSADVEDAFEGIMTGENED